MSGLHHIRALATIDPGSCLGDDLFERAGFTRYGLEKAAIQVEGRSYDQSYLRFELG